jgi:hypothetical protein
MSLRATHHSYAYQDLITGIALVDLMLGTADAIAVDITAFADPPSVADPTMRQR